MGTRLEFEGVGVVTCNDRGGGLLYKQLDYWCYAWSTCKAWLPPWPWRVREIVP